MFFIYSFGSVFTWGMFEILLLGACTLKSVCFLMIWLQLYEFSLFWKVWLYSLFWSWLCLVLTFMPQFFMIICSLLSTLYFQGFFSFLFGHPHSMRKFVVQGSYLRHSSNLGQISDNTASVIDRKLLSFFFFFFFKWLHPPWHMEVPGQGLTPSHSYDLCCSCGSARSFSPLC